MAKRKPDYKKLYPGISDELVLFLRKSDRKIEYMEYDLKREVYIVEEKTLTVVIKPSREDSYERLTENNVQFSDDADSVENVVLYKLMVDRLYECLALLTKDERDLIAALFFCGYSERQWSAKTGIPQKTINNRRQKILAKLKKLMEN